ncbi:MAG: PorP/SprF family type IX secretion system membrane protein [Bacteroidota bacterium]
MKKIIILFIICLSFRANSQQVPQYSQWFWNMYQINPAFTGLKQCLEIKTVYRNQWANLEGSPNSGFLTFSSPIYTLRKKEYTPRQGCGFIYETDKIGPFSMNRFNLSYAGHFNFTANTRLSMGVSAGFKQWVFDKSKVTTLVPDPIISESTSYFSPDASFGLWWNGKNYFVSASFKELIRSKWDNIGDNSRFKIHTFLNAGLRKSINENFTLLPYLLLRIPPKGPASMDLNLVLNYNNRIDFGIGFRNTDALTSMIQIKFRENFAIAYSFDYVLSKLGRNQFFTHEFGLTYGTCRGKSTSKTICPLF